MKSYELKPTRENFLNTLCSDSLGRNADVFHFIRILNNIDYGCSIALDGGWGSGKTFFVNHAKMILDANNNLLPASSDSEKARILKTWESINKDRHTGLMNQVSVYYDAWENDKDEEPVFSLVYSILNSGESDFYFKPDASVSKMALGILDFFTGKDFSKLASALRVNDPLKDIKTEKSIHDMISDFFNSLLPERGDRLVIFIDELDRCRPSYAVRLLERIKHYFLDERITFVFSVNINELQHTIKQYYGAQFDASKYLSRFFNLRLSLPKVDLAKYYRSLSVYFSSHLYNAVCDAVIRTLNFELREISQYIQMTNAAAYKIVHGNTNEFRINPYHDGLDFGIYLFVPVIIGLKIHSQSLYREFIDGNDDSSLIEICSLLDDLYFGMLFNDKELSSIENQNNAVVGIEKDKKIKELYKALFNNKTFSSMKGVRVGKLLFHKDVKDELIKISNLFSINASLD